MKDKKKPHLFIQTVMIWLIFIKAMEFPAWLNITLMIILCLTLLFRFRSMYKYAKETWKELRGIEQYAESEARKDKENKGKERFQELLAKAAKQHEDR